MASAGPSRAGRSSMSSLWSWSRAPGPGPNPSPSAPRASAASASVASSSAAAAASRSAQTSLSRAVSRSASRRELAKTRVERCSAMRSTMRSSTWGQIDVRRGSPAAGPLRSPVGSPSAPRSSTGTTTLRSQRFSEGGRTMLTGRPPARKRATSSTGSTVALSPIRWAGRSRSASSRSRESARCAPRLVPATAWTSSTMTVSTPARALRAAEVSMRKSDSGVVMRMSGGVVASWRRCCAGVSPDRTATVTSGTATPSRAAARSMPTSGARRLRWTSVASALSGET